MLVQRYRCLSHIKLSGIRTLIKSWNELLLRLTWFVAPQCLSQGHSQTLWGAILMAPFCIGTHTQISDSKGVQSMCWIPHWIGWWIHCIPERLSRTVNWNHTVTCCLPITAAYCLPIIAAWALHNNSKWSHRIVRENDTAIVLELRN